MPAVEWIAVVATATVRGITYTAESTADAYAYDTDPNARDYAHHLARCHLEDTIREANPAVPLREAYDARVFSTITTTRYTADTPEAPF